MTGVDQPMGGWVLDRMLILDGMSLRSQDTTMGLPIVGRTTGEQLEYNRLHSPVL